MVKYSPDVLGSAAKMPPAMRWVEGQGTGTPNRYNDFTLSRRGSSRPGQAGSDGLEKSGWQEVAQTEKVLKLVTLAGVINQYGVPTSEEKGYFS
ncbi:MAG TPA: hypothetical protein VE133_13855 [Candidatus Sulfotelmatobacter sp.]|nr:hypothetical protein [Candidatus Sulfotelmatobacter sp.]